MKLPVGFNLFIETFKEWDKDNVPHLSAALSYYTIFSLAPLLVICIALIGYVIEQNRMEHVLIDQINQALGSNTGATIQALMENIKKPTTNIIAAVLGILILMWGVAGLFSEIQYCFNVIWKVKPKTDRNWMEFLKNRFFSFAMILGIGFLLLTSLLISTFLSTISEKLHYLFPINPYIWMIWDFIISITVITFLFAVIFKILPNMFLKWSDVFLGAFITAILFGLGKFLLSIYLASSNIVSIYGAAASLIILLVWVYYTTQILLWGAEFSKVYAYQCGSLRHLKNE